MTRRRTRRKTSAIEAASDAGFGCNSNNTNGEGVFVKLTKTLDQHAAVLDPSLKHKEMTLRVQLVESFVLHRESCEVLGRVLYDYKLIFKGRQLWMRIVRDISKIVKYSESTLFRYVKWHEVAIGVRNPQPRKKAGRPQGEHDGGEVNLSLSHQEERFLLSRAQFRESLTPFEGRERWRVLEQLISAEAYEVWGERQHLVLEITPAPSPIIIRDQGCSTATLEYVADVTEPLTLHQVNEEHRVDLLPKPWPEPDSERV